MRRPAHTVLTVIQTRCLVNHRFTFALGLVLVTTGRPDRRTPPDILGDRMSADCPRWKRPDLGDLIEQRAGEAMELNQRYLNRQLGRVVKTLGFDRQSVHGRGEYLIDAEGERYLDLYAGFGVFGIGRNHPYVRDQLMSVMAAEPANLPQIGVTTLAGVLAEELVGRAPASIDAAVLCSSGTEAVEAALKLAGHLLRARLPRPDHGLAVGQRQRRVP